MKKLLMISCALLLAFGVAQNATADVINPVENEPGAEDGSFFPSGDYLKLGIGHMGNLATAFGNGFNYDPAGTGTFTGYDWLGVGWIGDGYTFTYDGTYGAYYTGGPRANYTYVSENIIANTPSLAEYQTVMRSADGKLEITHDFVFQKDSKALVLNATVENISGASVAGVQYKRITDWDVYGSAGYNYWDYLMDSFSVPIMRAYNSNRYAAVASASATPHTLQDGYAWDDRNNATSVQYADPDNRRMDGNALLLWDIGILDPGETYDLTMYYLAGDSDSDLVATYNDIDNPVPEPATMLLLGSGLIGIAGLGRKKLSIKK